MKQTLKWITSFLPLVNYVHVAGYATNWATGHVARASESQIKDRTVLGPHLYERFMDIIYKLVGSETLYSYGQMHQNCPVPSYKVLQ